MASCWKVDPERPSLLVLDLVDGRYLETAHVVGEEVAELDRPFPVAVRPSELGLRR